MDLFTLMGTIKINYDNALAAIDTVRTEAQGLAEYLNTGDGAGSGASQSETSGTFFSNMFTSLGKTATKGLTALDVAAGNLLSSAITKTANAGKSFMQTGYMFNKNMEVWTASFKTYLGGDENAAVKMMEQVRQFAIDTPLAVSDAVQSAVRIMASGIGSDQVIDTLQMLGDIANGDTTKMSRLALVYSQVMSAGKLGGNDPIQFKEAGVPIYDLLEQYYRLNGIEASDMAEMQKKGLILSEHVQGALLMSTQEGGMYFNAMANQMDTAMGKAQKMQDSYEQTAGAFAKAFFDVFNVDTINALNSSLDKLYSWASTNPEGLKLLADSFSSFATNGIDVLVKSLTTLVDYYGDHFQEISMLMSLLGTILTVGGHPALGLGMIAMGQIGMGVYAENKVDSDIKAAAEAEKNGEDPGWTITSALLDDAAEEKLKNGYTYNDLTEQEKTSYDFTKAVQTTLGHFDAAWKNFAIWDNIPVPDEAHTIELDPSMFSNATDKDSDDSELPGWIQFLHGIFPSLVVDPSEMPDGQEIYGPPTPEWFNPDNVIPDGTSGDNGFLATLAAMLQPLSTLKADVAAAAQEGVTAGVSNITVTGSITTGNVMLNEGVIAGRIAPRLNLQLGLLNQRSNRG